LFFVKRQLRIYLDNPMRKRGIEDNGQFPRLRIGLRLVYSYLPHAVKQND